MKSFARFLREASAEKPFAFLQLPPNETLQPGYAPVEAFLGPCAPADICKLAHATWHDVSQQDLSPYPVEHVTVQALRPTQASVNLADIERFSTMSGVLDPVVVMRYDGALYILDGHHRVCAVRNLQRNTIPARIIEPQEF